VSFGHTGFIGTSFWIDPPHNCFVILLTNSVHPVGKGNVLALRRQVSTLIAEAFDIPAPPAPGT
jgi:CubicO group peptidase (beta-lactamase class C family)